MNHFIKKCKHCDIVIEQCRCPSKLKKEIEGVCDLHKNSEDREKSLLGIALKETKKTLPITNQHIQLALALAKGEVSHVAACKALDSKGRLDKNMNHWLGKVLKYAIRSEKIKIIPNY